MIEKLPLSRLEARDAARLAVQSAAAAAGMFMLMRSLGLAEEFVGILSAVLVVQPSIGHTVGAARNRIVATLVGSAIGIGCLVLLPAGYGTAAALALSMLVINAASALRPGWRYGTVAAVALALGSESDAFETAKARALAIAIGAAVGAIATIVVWPDSAGKRSRRHLRAALRAIAKRLDAAVEGARGGPDDDGHEARKKYHDHVGEAREAADGIRFGDREAMMTRVEKAERLYNSTLILNRVAEETDCATEGDEELARRVEKIREASCHAILALAGEDEELDRYLETIRTELERARSSATKSESDPPQHVLRCALIFGLKEVLDTLEDLAEAA